MWGEGSSLKTRVVTHPGANDAGLRCLTTAHIIATAANHGATPGPNN